MQNAVSALRAGAMSGWFVLALHGAKSGPAKCHALAALGTTSGPIDVTRR